MRMGQTKHRPFHSYTMKQAIQEVFILDVLAHYTPVESYYKLIKKIEGDPEFDTKRARKKLRRYVESHDHAIRLKAEIMVDHFHEQVLALNKIDGEARAMVVTGGIKHAIQYYHAIQQYLLERKSPYQAIVAFSGEHEYGGVKVSEASLNDFRSSSISDKIPAESVSVSHLRRQVPDWVRRAAVAYDVRGQGLVRDQGGPDAVASQQGTPEETRRVRLRLYERCHYHPKGIR